MTYEELKAQEKATEAEIKKIERRYRAAERRYIKEHAPFPLRLHQRVTIRLRVTEKSFAMMAKSERRKKCNQVGTEYELTGLHTGYGIEEKDGTIYPCFYRMAYRANDEILTYFPAIIQCSHKCDECIKAKDGLCYRNGGKDLGKCYADHKIKPDDFSCSDCEIIKPDGCYVARGWMDAGKFYPNLTYLPHRQMYRVYSLNWKWCEEYNESEFLEHYSLTKPDK